MKTHTTDLVSFIPGVIAIAVAIVALSGGLTLDLLATDWVWPSILIGLGLLVLASTGLGRREDRRTAPEAVDAGTVEDGGVEADRTGPGLG